MATVRRLVIRQPALLHEDARAVKGNWARRCRTRPDPNARASLRKELRGVTDESLHVYRDVTPLGWGLRFHDQDFVSQPSMALIARRGGRSA